MTGPNQYTCARLLPPVRIYNTRSRKVASYPVWTRRISRDRQTSRDVKIVRAGYLICSCSLDGIDEERGGALIPAELTHSLPTAVVILQLCHVEGRGDEPKGADVEGISRNRVGTLEVLGHDQIAIFSALRDHCPT